MLLSVRKQNLPYRYDACWTEMMVVVNLLVSAPPLEAGPSVWMVVFRAALGAF
jgi:hypothetical protein